MPQTKPAMLDKRNIPENFRLGKFRARGVGVHQLCETLGVFPARFRAIPGYFRGPFWAFGRSLRAWSMHIYTAVSAGLCKQPRAVVYLLPPVGTPRCRYPSLQGRVYFCACRRPSARNRSMEEPCSEQPRCSWLPHTGSCCSEAPLQPTMHGASVRCSSIMNNPLIELVPPLCLSTVYKSREA